MRNLNALDWIALILLTIGGLAWGVIGVFNYDFVTGALGSVIAQIVFILVGISAIYEIFVVGSLGKK